MKKRLLWDFIKGKQESAFAGMINGAELVLPGMFGGRPCLSGPSPTVISEKPYFLYWVGV